MRLKWLWIAVVFLPGCALSRPQLNWPAQVISLGNLSTSARNIVTADIEELNDRLGMAILTIGSGEGSPISIKQVTSFTSSGSSSTVHQEFAYIGMPGARGVGGTTIAGRATLDIDGCTIELASFLFGEPELLNAVLWHEIGHCAGLMHVTQQNELMSRITLEISDYSEEKLQRFFDSILSSIQGF